MDERLRREALLSVPGALGLGPWAFGCCSTRCPSRLDSFVFLSTCHSGTRPYGPAVVNRAARHSGVSALRASILAPTPSWLRAPLAWFCALIALLYALPCCSGFTEFNCIVVAIKRSELADEILPDGEGVFQLAGIPAAIHCSWIRCFRHYQPDRQIL